MADKPNREKRPIGVVEIIKGLVVSSLALLSIALLYDVAGYYKGEDIQAKFVVLTIFPAAYLWWIVERVLNRLGLERSREYSLLVAVILSVWILSATLGWGLEGHIAALVRSVWAVFEETIDLIVGLFA